MFLLGFPIASQNIYCDYRVQNMIWGQTERVLKQLESLIGIEWSLIQL